MANNTLLASDNFASGSLAAGWSAFFTVTESQVIGSPFVTEPVSTVSTNGQQWSGLTWPNDQSSEATVKTLTTEVGTYLNLAVRCRTGGASFSGYTAQITDGTVTLIRFDSGTPTTLATASYTSATGDVWNLSAIGSCISVYQNGNRLCFAGDATYTGGVPGYYQSSSVNVTHSQVASWRGYSAVQQDGIWQKQGVVLAPTNTDLSGSGIGVYEGSCIYDSNPQILAGPMVYKLWFSVGTASAASTYYAESPDLVNWMRHSGAVIANFTTPQVIKSGSTYHLYCQAGNAQGSGNIAHYTSTDGINWSQQSTNVMTISQAWEGTSLYPLKPIAIINGTWYAIYGSIGTHAFSKVGLATSTDGATWTKYVSNPVISTICTYPYACVAQVGNTFYVWMQRGAPSEQNTNASAYLFDPTSCVRYSTTDFINWVGPIQSLNHSQLNETLNVPVNNTEAVGGTAPIAIFNISGKANMLYGGNQGDNVGPQVSQYSLAIAPAPIASIVGANEDAVSQVASDNFARGAGSIGSNWTVVAAYGIFKIVSGSYAEPNATATDSLMVYTASNFGTNLYSEITVHAFAATGNMTPLLATLAGKLYYATIVTAAGTQGLQAEINYYDGTTSFPLTPAVGMTVNTGDVLRLSLTKSAVGDVLSFFQNGSLVSQGVNYQPSPTGLFPGAYMKEGMASQTQISLWAGGNTNVIPAYPSGASSSWLTTALINSLRGLKH